MERLAGSLALVALLATTSAGVAQPAATDAVREPESGTPFPFFLTPPGGTKSHRLVGTGTRQRTVFRVNVYAFGLYVDPTGARDALAAFEGRRASELLRDIHFRRRLLDLDFAMTLRLVMTRRVAGGDVAEAFDDALRPRMARVRQGDEHAAAAALARLHSYLAVDHVQRGTEIAVSCEPNGRLTTSIGQAQRTPIESRALCRALFDVYLGENPIERDARRNIIAGLSRLLAPFSRPRATRSGRP